MGLVGMVVMMVNVFSVMKYGGKVEGREKMRGGNEGRRGEGWKKVDIEGRAGEAGI